MAENKDSCVQPAGGPLPAVGTTQEKNHSEFTHKQEIRMTAQVGKPAPDFEASAYIDGGFKNIKLSDYKDQWVVLCFYPGDFTFV
jgi:hypothetical protein